MRRHVEVKASSMLWFGDMILLQVLSFAFMGMKNIACFLLRGDRVERIFYWRERESIKARSCSLNAITLCLK
jgi:hypothetical protein